MDAYTKAILTMIAVCLLAITVKLYEPQIAIAEAKSAGKFLGPSDKTQIVRIGPTVGEMLTLMQCNTEDCKSELARLLKRVPLVKEIDR